MSEARQLAKRTLGNETSSLNHPQWSERGVINNLIYCTVFHQGEVIWRGICDIDGLGSLIDRLPDITLFKAPLRAGFHY